MKSKFVKLFFVVFVIIIVIFGVKNFLKSSNNSKKEQNVTKELLETEAKTENIEDTIETGLKKDNEIEQEKNVVKEDTTIVLTAIGDIMCHNTQYKDAYNAETDDYDFSYVFDDVKDATEKTDIFVGNLETTFAGKEKGYSNYPTFNTPEHLATDLKELGIDILTTANNHCMDSGYKGIESTLNYLDEAEILHTGTNRSVEEQNTVLIKEEKGIKIAFLSFTYGTNGISIPKDREYAVNLIDEDFILSQINLAKKEKPDLICVSIHWGIEYQTNPNAEQTHLADFMIKNGVDIILGSHPHILQPMEFREVNLDNGQTKKGFVIYSLGNFMSGQVKNGTRTSIILNLDITKKGDGTGIFIDSISYTPIYTYTRSKLPKYKVMDIGRAIEKYENGEDKGIGETNYNLFKSEFDRVKSLMDI